MKVKIEQSPSPQRLLLVDCRERSEEGGCVLGLQLFAHRPLGGRSSNEHSFSRGEPQRGHILCSLENCGMNSRDLYWFVIRVSRILN
jgi:hypothetical protein